jgi:hypothetical protein
MIQSDRAMEINAITDTANKQDVRIFNSEGIVQMVYLVNKEAMGLKP